MSVRFWLVCCFEDIRRCAWWYFSHIATWEQEITNLWNRSGKTGNRTPDLLLRKPRAYPLHHRCTYECYVMKLYYNNMLLKSQILYTGFCHKEKEYLKVFQFVYMISTFPFITNTRSAVLLIVQGFHRTYATGAACQQRTLTPPDTWSCHTLGLACVLMSRPISPEFVLSPDLWISNIPRYFSFALNTWQIAIG